jgi:hypothetical protein
MRWRATIQGVEDDPLLRVGKKKKKKKKKREGGRVVFGVAPSAQAARGARSWSLRDSCVRKTI